MLGIRISRISMALGFLLSFFSTVLYAQEIRPAVVYGNGGKFDKSYSESAWVAMENFSREFGIDYREFVPTGDAQGEQAIRNFASRGFDPIVVISFNWTSAVEKVSQEYPKARFITIDAIVDSPNVHSITFKEEEGSYLAGILAAMASKNNKIGYISGVDVPLMRRFSCGYAQGAHSIKPDIEVYRSVIGSTSSAWSDPVRGGEIAQNQIDQGVDVIYAAASTSGLGVLQAAADNHVLSIGVDSNQNYLHPGSVLTSMEKRIDLVVYNALVEAMKGNFVSGVVRLGIKEGGVSVAMDEHNASLITDEMKEALEAAKAGITEGNIHVHDYVTDNSCPS